MPMTADQIFEMEKLTRGIAAYGRHQRMLLRLLRMKQGRLTSDEFDVLFCGRERRRRVGRVMFSGDTFILGMGRGGSRYWREMLELLQCMISLEIVCVTRRGDDIVYYLPGVEVGDGG